MKQNSTKTLEKWMKLIEKGQFTHFTCEHSCIDVIIVHNHKNDCGMITIDIDSGDMVVYDVKPVEMVYNHDNTIQYMWETINDALYKAKNV